MSARPTPAAIGFPLDASAPSHVPILAEWNAETGTAPCRRCGRRIRGWQWTGEPCSGPATTPQAVLAFAWIPVERAAACAIHGTFYDRAEATCPLCVSAAR